MKFILKTGVYILFFKSFPRKSYFFPTFSTFYKMFFRLTRITAHTSWGNIIGNLTPIEQFGASKGLKTALHSNYYLKLTSCAKRQNFPIFYEEIWGKNPEMEKWGKSYDQDWVYVFHFFLHLSKNPFPPPPGGGGFCKIYSIHPCVTF